MALRKMKMISVDGDLSDDPTDHGEYNKLSPINRINSELWYIAVSRAEHCVRRLRDLSPMLHRDEWMNLIWDPITYRQFESERSSHQVGGLLSKNVAVYVRSESSGHQRHLILRKKENGGYELFVMKEVQCVPRQYSLRRLKDFPKDELRCLLAEIWINDENTRRSQMVRNEGGERMQLLKNETIQGAPLRERQQFYEEMKNKHQREKDKLVEETVKLQKEKHYVEGKYGDAKRKLEDITMEKKRISIELDAQRSKLISQNEIHRQDVDVLKSENDAATQYIDELKSTISERHREICTQRELIATEQNQMTKQLEAEKKKRNDQISELQNEMREQQRTMKIEQSQLAEGIADQQAEMRRDFAECQNAAAHSERVRLEELEEMMRSSIVRDKIETHHRLKDSMESESIVRIQREEKEIQRINRQNAEQREWIRGREAAKDAERVLMQKVEEKDNWIMMSGYIGGGILLVLGIIVMLLRWRVNMMQIPLNEERRDIAKIELHAIPVDAELRH